MQTGIELFERAAEAKARLLRVARFRAESAGATGLLLTFDVGLIAIEPLAADDAALAVSHPEEEESPPQNLDPLDEEEPWWRLLGSPLTAVWPGTDGPPLREIGLRFREPEDAARVVTLVTRGGSVATMLDASREVSN